MIGVWEHWSGRRYTVIAVANEDARCEEEYPVTVVYKGSDGRIWARKLSEFLDKSKKVDDEIDRPRST